MRGKHRQSRSYPRTKNTRKRRKTHFGLSLGLSNIGRSELGAGGRRRVLGAASILTTYLIMYAPRRITAQPLFLRLGLIRGRGSAKR